MLWFIFKKKGREYTLCDEPTSTASRIKNNLDDEADGGSQKAKHSKIHTAENLQVLLWYCRPRFKK